MRHRTILLLAAVFLLPACDMQSKGFSLPPGDAAQGEVTFVLMQCNNCHSVQNPDGSVAVPWDGGEAADDALHVALGGTTTRVRTYGDLVTSIIHPSHKISERVRSGEASIDGESTMRDYNDIMTVQELIDLVSFLQSRYDIWIPEYYAYRR